MSNVAECKQARWLETSLQDRFELIYRQRMADLPFINSQLQVQALPFLHYQEHWTGILITPWFMNLMLFPLEQATWQEMHPGQKIHYGFPYGEFAFTIAVDAILGTYAMCSLYSPMQQFQQQEIAVATARSAFQALFDLDHEWQQFGAQKEISRRDLLRGKFSNRYSNN